MAVASCLLLGPLLFSACSAAAAAGTAPANETQHGLLEGVLGATSEEAARRLLEPYMERLREVPAAAVESIVFNQWWDLARDLVARSHLQKVDLAGPVRKATKALREEGEEVLRRLNPKYGQAQLVAPAFQWAQSDTSIFLTIKYTVRWNAPGALDIQEPSVNMSLNVFNFSAFGKHSNNIYRYFLSLRVFDYIDVDASTWTTASVGKLSVTLRKRSRSKWPRLLADKKQKIGNMHVWMDQQERMAGSIEDLEATTNSPATCGAQGMLLCMRTGFCKPADRCSECPGKEKPVAETGLCEGPPSNAASLSFSDEEPSPNAISGSVTIGQAQYEMDIDVYKVYWGSGPLTKLAGQQRHLMDATPRGGTTAIGMGYTLLPEGATHLLVFSENAYGECEKPGGWLIVDKALPASGPAALEFEDEDADKGEIGGAVVLHQAADRQGVENYEVHWGRSERKKISGRSLLVDARPDARQADVTIYIPRDKRVPENATHLLAFARNSDGEHPVPAVRKLVDATRPCIHREDSGCPVGVSVTEDLDPDPLQAQFNVSITKALVEAGLWSYSVYWGARMCQEGPSRTAKVTQGPNHADKLRRIGTFKVGTPLEARLKADTPIPPGAKFILAFVVNRFGESELCVSTPFVDNQEAAVRPPEEEL